jgi:tRNA threonylcarbamoyladenosine biosynthesis protein TsaE
MVHTNLMPIAISSDNINLSSENKTEELAQKILKKLKKGDVVFLYGEMGVGKTTFIKYLINGFQKLNKLKLTEVTSPTFNLLNEYQMNELKINHYDLFRLKSHDEILNLGLFEDKKDSITLIEWPEIIKKKPKNLIELRFKYENDHEKRSVQIKNLRF